MFKYYFSFLVFLFFKTGIQAQQTYLPKNSEEAFHLERLETLSGRFSNDLFLTNQSISRKDMVNFLNIEKGSYYESPKSNIDNYNINRAINLSSEWQGIGSADESAYPIFNTFYKQTADFFRIENRDFFFSLNPVLSFASTFENDQERKVLFNTAQGIEIRGKYRNTLGFYFKGTHHFEQAQTYQENYIRKWEAIPQAGKYDILKNGYEYWKLRGYIDVPLIKDYISLTAGYDDHFIGDGIRTLFLSNHSEAALFGKVNTKIWRLHYQNIFLKLQPERFSYLPKQGGNKYATVHHLSVNVRPWLNIGVFETVTFSRDGGYEFGYLNPVIFYRAVERSLGSPDKVSIGINSKAILFKSLNIYGQFLLNEFTSKEFFARNGYWANKWGAQLGINYYNAFKINNLDLQAEMNWVRPYTFTHSDRIEGQNISHYTHYNQPLAHPLGAGFKEYIFHVHYQPIPKLTINMMTLFYQQGVDTGNTNLGTDIFKDYRTRSGNHGFRLVNGPIGNHLLFHLNASYELKPRLHIDLGGMYRNEENQDLNIKNEVISFHVGLRLNLNRSNLYLF